MIETNPPSFVRRQTAALRRATFTSMGFPPGTLRDASQDDVLFTDADFGPHDGPVESPVLADRLFRGRHPDGWRVDVFTAPALPCQFVFAEWDVRDGRPVRARRIVVEPAELGATLVRLVIESAKRHQLMSDEREGTQPAA